MLTPEWRKRIYADKQVAAARASRKLGELIRVLEAKREASYEPAERQAIEALIAEVRARVVKPDARSEAAAPSDAVASSPRGPVLAPVGASRIKPVNPVAQQNRKIAIGLCLFGGTTILLMLVAMAVLTSEDERGGGSRPINALYLYSSLDTEIMVSLGEDSYLLEPWTPKYVALPPGTHTVQVMRSGSDEVVFEEEIRIGSEGLHVYDAFGLSRFLELGYYYAENPYRAPDPTAEEFVGATFHVRPEVNYVFDEELPDEIYLAAGNDMEMRHWFGIEDYSLNLERESAEEMIAHAEGALRAMPSLEQQEAIVRTVEVLLHSNHSGSFELDWPSLIDASARLGPYAPADSRIGRLWPHVDNLAQALEESPEFLLSLQRLLNEPELLEPLLATDTNGRRVWVALGRRMREVVTHVDPGVLDSLLAYDAATIEEYVPVDPARPMILRYAAFNGLERGQIEQLEQAPAAILDQLLYVIGHYVDTDGFYREEWLGITATGVKIMRFYAEASPDWHARLDGLNQRHFLSSVAIDDPPGLQETVASWSPELTQAVARESEHDTDFQLYIDMPPQLHGLMQRIVESDSSIRVALTYLDLPPEHLAALCQAFPLDEPWELPADSRLTVDHTLPAEALAVLTEIGNPFLRWMIFQDGSAFQRTESEARFGWIYELGERDKKWIRSLSTEEIAVWLGKPVIDAPLLDLPESHRSLLLALARENPAEVPRILGYDRDARMRVLEEWAESR